MSTPPGEEGPSPNPPTGNDWSWESHGTAEPAAPDSAGLRWEGGAPTSPDAPPAPAAPGKVDPFATTVVTGTLDAAPTPAPAEEGYPARFDVEYPDRLSRWKALLRPFLVLPPLLAASLIYYLLYLGVLAGYMTVFWKKKYPDWLFQANAGAMGFLARTTAYALLLTDRYPSFGPEGSPVRLEFDQPPSGRLSRWRVLFWKSVLLFPMAIVLYFLWLAVMVVSVLAWFAVLITGSHPRGLFQFSVGVQRWSWRMLAYQSSFNDRYPPYALSSDAGPGSKGSVVINGVIGGVLASGYAALIIAAIATANDHATERVSYAQLLAGRGQVSHHFDSGGGDGVTLRLTSAVDPGDELIQIIRPARGERIVVVRWTVSNESNLSAQIAGGAARMEYRYSDRGKTKTKTEDAEFIGVNNVSAPAMLREGGDAVVQAVFVVPDDAEPTAIWFQDGFAHGGVKYELR